MAAPRSNQPRDETQPEPVRFRASYDPDRGVVGLYGQLDVETVAVLKGVIDLAVGHEGDLVLDLAGLDFMDSTGLGALVRLRNRRAGPYHDVVLRRPQVRVRQLLAVTGLDRVFPVTDGLSVDRESGGAAGSY